MPSIVVDQRPGPGIRHRLRDGHIAQRRRLQGHGQSFNLIVKLREGIDTWRFALVDKDGVERSVFAGKGDDVPNKIVWDGRDSSGAVVHGDYTGVFSVDYLKGDHAEARTGKILVDTTRLRPRSA